MGQRSEEIVVSIRMAWWFWLYFYGLVAVCWFTGLPPNYEKVNYWTIRAMRPINRSNSKCPKKTSE